MHSVHEVERKRPSHARLCCFSVYNTENYQKGTKKVLFSASQFKRGAQLFEEETHTKKPRRIFLLGQHLYRNSKDKKLPPRRFCSFSSEDMLEKDDKCRLLHPGRPGVRVRAALALDIGDRKMVRRNAKIRKWKKVGKEGRKKERKAENIGSSFFGRPSNLVLLIPSRTPSHSGALTD